jgi:hypothetical protein
MTDKRDIPSIQCKINLRESRPMRKVDGLSLILIEFYVPVVTPRISYTETSLQLSESITTFSVYRIYTGVICKRN